MRREVARHGRAAFGADLLLFLTARNLPPCSGRDDVRPHAGLNGGGYNY